MAEAHDVALAPHCPLGPIALAACLNVDATSYNAVIQEQSIGIHYNVGKSVLDYVTNKEDFAFVDVYKRQVDKLVEGGLCHQRHVDLHGRELRDTVARIIGVVISDYAYIFRHRESGLGDRLECAVGQPVVKSDNSRRTLPAVF